MNKIKDGEEMKEKKNAGFTLVELLVAMLMSLILITGVGQFMAASTNNYQAVDKQVNLQMEAQSVINSISDMVLEANNVAFVTASDGEKYFIIYYNLGEKSSTGGVMDKTTAKQNIIWLDSSEHKLYLFTCNSKDDYNDAMGPKANKMLFAEGVHNIQYAIATATGNTTLNAKGLDASATQSAPMVKIDVELWSKVTSNSKKEDGYIYKASDTVAPRNEIVAIP